MNKDSSGGGEGDAQYFLPMICTITGDTDSVRGKMPELRNDDREFHDARQDFVTFGVVHLEWKTEHTVTRVILP